MNFKSLLFICSILLCTNSFAQDASAVDIKWKTESQVRNLLGEPISIHGPVGTHASYTLWKYQNMYVAFANNKAFHRFEPGSLKKVELIDAK